MTDIQQMKAEIDRLQRFETAYKEFSDKTDWVQETVHWSELGMHRADVLRKRCDDLTSQNQAQAEEIVRLRKDAERYRWLSANSFDREKTTQFHVWQHTWEPHSQTGEPTKWINRVRGPAIARLLDAAMAQEQQP